jgi:hypothetical protein
MMRWNDRKARYAQNAVVDNFIEELVTVCRKHGLCIGHEDSHGAFIIENLTEGRVNWLRTAHDNTNTVTRTTHPVTRTTHPNPAGQPNSTTKES